MKDIFKYKILIFLSLILLAACEEETQTYDIEWPVPEVTSFSPAEQMVGNELIITGNSFTKVTRISVGGSQVADDNILSMSETEIVIKVPRQANTGPIEIENAYEKVGLSDDNFVPQYPETTISTWPAVIYRGQNFAIEGENVDLITKVQINGVNVNVDGSRGTANSVSIPGATVDLKGVDMVDVIVVSAKGGLSGVVSTSGIPVEDPSDLFDAQEPLILFDFEDGVNPYDGEGMSSLNGGDITVARGDNYLHIEGTNPEQWYSYGLITAQEVNPGAEGFHDPHISFLVNTADAEGYFHMMIIQGGTTYEAHFNNAPDDFKFKTDGWEWRSYTLDPSSPDAGQFKEEGFDPMQAFTMQLQIRNGNIGTGNFEINFDQVMITDGKVNPFLTLWDFEGVDPFVVNGESSSHGFNVSGLTPVTGEQYYTVKKSAVNGWTDLGYFESDATLDLSELEDPFLNFWVNSNGSGGGYFQLEDGQGNWLHFTPGGTGDDYKFVTDGWERRSIRLKEAGWEGDGSFDAGAFKPRFSIKTGNVGNSGAPEEFEFNIDNVTISDGPMF